MQIKSRLLLPKDEARPAGDEADDPDAELDPRWELVQQLLTYQKFKQAAGELGELIDAQQHFVARAGSLVENTPAPERPLRPVDRVELWNTFNQVLRRLSERMTIGAIQAETVTIAERMEVVLQRLQETPRFRFSELFPTASDRRPVVLVATFLAILELTRLGHLDVAQCAPFADIECTRIERPPPTLRPAME